MRQDGPRPTRGVGKGEGTSGTCPPPKFTRRNIFLPEQHMEFVTFNQIFSIIVRILEALPQPHRGLCACMDPAGD